MASIYTIPVVAQTKEELEVWHTKPDHWGYTTTPDDLRRKKTILHALAYWPRFKRVLDIGACEGWLTQHLPADEIHGYEISDNAAARFPKNVTRVLDPQGKYDLVVATGVLYPQYDWDHFVNLIKAHASNIVLTSNIKSWEVMAAILTIPGKEIFSAEFSYRDYVQKLRIFDVSPSQHRPTP